MVCYDFGLLPHTSQLQTFKQSPQKLPYSTEIVNGVAYSAWMISNAIFSFQLDTQYEFVVLREAGLPGAWTLDFMANEEYLCANYYDVLALETVDGVSERGGIGLVLQSALSESLPPGPIWKEFVMS